MGHYGFLCLPGFNCAWIAAAVDSKTTPSSLLSSSSAHSMDSYLLYVAIWSSVPLGIRPLPLFVLFLLICFVCSATGGLFTVSLLLSLIFVLPFFVCFASLFAGGDRILPYGTPSSCGFSEEWVLSKRNLNFLPFKKSCLL